MPLLDTLPAYDDQNVFAKILRGELPCHKIYEDEHTLAFMDIMPRGDGHALVIPKTASRNIFDIDPQDLATLMTSTQIVARASVTAFQADGCTIQHFAEEAGGQVVFHTHIHVIPRFADVTLRPHSSEMADQDMLASHAEQIRAAIAQG